MTHARPFRPPPRLGRAVPWDARGCFLPAAGGRRRRKMPGKLKVKIVAGRHLPVMDRASDLTDAFVEVCGRGGTPGPGAGGRPPPRARTCRRPRGAEAPAPPPRCPGPPPRGAPPAGWAVPPRGVRRSAALGGAGGLRARPPCCGVGPRSGNGADSRVRVGCGVCRAASGYARE